MQNTGGRQIGSEENVPYGITESGADFPDRPANEQLQHFSHLGDMRQGRMNPNAVDAKMTVEEALEFNRQQAALPKPEPEEEELAPEGATEPEFYGPSEEQGGYLTYPFPRVKTTSGETKDYTQPRREPMNIP